MPNRAELETQLVNEIHSMPLEALEIMLKLTQLLHKANFTETPQQSNNFADFIRNSPLIGVDLDLTRDQSPCREIEL